MTTSLTLTALREKMRLLADKKQAEILSRFFKTGPGEYGEGDVFLGIKVPLTRRLAREGQDLPFGDLEPLLESPLHEERLLALLILVCQFQKGGEDRRREIFLFFLKQTHRINNWDLVDLSAPHILGAYLYDHDKRIPRRLVRSADLWERRLAVLASLYFIRRNVFTETLRIAEMLLGDPEDLIHKAVGWMLREVGKGDLNAAEAFLRIHYPMMPRTMLRYAIERFPEEKRLGYLKRPGGLMRK
jgi:3-methyladenine DNA glycosylase AlkD